MKRFILVIAFFAQSILGMSIGEVTEKVKDRLVPVDITIRTFDGETRAATVRVLDACVDSVKSIFKKLFEINFPIYVVDGHVKKTIGNGLPSFHAFGLAIDLNYLMNPCYNVPNSTIIPERFIDRDVDTDSITRGLEVDLKLPQSEINAVLKATIQEKGSDDWFLNRNVKRRGMVTDEVVDVFLRNGFKIWGGSWRQPIDYIHFQCGDRQLAETLIKAAPEEATRLWTLHLEKCQRPVMS